MAKESYDIAIISTQTAAITKMAQIAKTFGYRYQTWRDIEAFMKDAPECRMVFATAANGEKIQSAAELAQVAKTISSNAFVVCAVDGKLGRDAAIFAKKSGANLVILEEEITGTSKLTYVCTQILNSNYLPIKISDLVAGSEVTFDICHFMPIRGKFIKFIFEGDKLDENRLQKLKNVGELYIQKASAEKFSIYAREHQAKSVSGLAGRCRAQYLALLASYTQLSLLLTDQSEYGSYQEGERLLAKCRAMAEELIGALAEFGNAWDIINNSAIGSFLIVDRAPALAAYAGLHSMQLEFENVQEIILAALFVDLGLLMLPDTIIRKLQMSSLEKLTPEEEALYRSYPQESLNILLDRKLSITENVRNLILSTHERADGKGFPRGLPGKKILDGANLIGFCREFDRRTIFLVGKPRVSHEEERKRMIQEALKDMNRFTATFTARMKARYL